MFPSPASWRASHPAPLIKPSVVTISPHEPPSRPSRHVPSIFFLSDDRELRLKSYVQCRFRYDMSFGMKNSAACESFGDMQRLGDGETSLPKAQIRVTGIVRTPKAPSVLND
jgi:hypothetical protein